MIAGFRNVFRRATGASLRGTELLITTEMPTIFDPDADIRPLSDVRTTSLHLRTRFDYGARRCDAVTE